MREHYKFFKEVNTFKVHTQTILNRLRKLKDPNLVNAIDLVIDGHFNSSFPAEIVTLNALLNHPEQFIKNIDSEAKEEIQSEIKEMLACFVSECRDEIMCARAVVRV
ncbi:MULTISPECIES: hypothetical protein [Legionella]|uniref:Uncharacterized protein n=1 Tax=Legionella resiliens TaxID=2905958 RepID=A0ABS8XC29_9GAMM|nr:MULTISPECIES: hypothetical protein [unclassified Legionella]MCE0724442.1 hypothetical protein [Legionella sp. 9fVS26]MCE3533594.1 hypothetical protein [Legionella sp. 8cVS16]QLZ69784.1 hypothetical protein FOLKNPGA_02583 [Legionella sp. PC1000]